MKTVDKDRIIQHTNDMRTETAKEGSLMKTVTTDTTLKFSVREADLLDQDFGIDAEFYEQHGMTWVVQLTDPEAGTYGMPEVFPIERNLAGQIISGETPEHDFDWESAEAFRGGPFPS